MAREAETGVEAYDRRRIESSKKAWEDFRKVSELVLLLKQIQRKDRGSPYHLHCYDLLRHMAPPGVYELHKSKPDEPKFYAVLGVSDHSEISDEYFVTASALYPPFNQGQIVNRPLLGDGGFFTPILVESAPSVLWKPRFQWIRPLKMRFEALLELETG